MENPKPKKFFLGVSPEKKPESETLPTSTAIKGIAAAVNADGFLAKMMAEAAEGDSEVNCIEFLKLFSNIPTNVTSKMLALALVSQTELVQLIAILLDITHVLTHSNFLDIPRKEQERYQTVRRAMMSILQERLREIFEVTDKHVVTPMFKSIGDDVKRPTSGALGKFFESLEKPKESNGGQKVS